MYALQKGKPWKNTDIREIRIFIGDRSPYHNGLYKISQNQDVLEFGFENECIC